MRILRGESKSELTQALSASRRAATDKLEKVEADVREILMAVRAGGDEALLEYIQRFDGALEGPIRVSAEEIEEAYAATPPELIAAMQLAEKNIRAYHSEQAYAPLHLRADGADIRQISRPIGRVGIYVPGGRFPYPSTVLMTAIPASCAGVKEIALCTPAKGGKISPNILAAAKIAGIAEIYKVGGAQAIGAMAYGTKSIPAADKICGPGNVYVTCAKKLVFGTVGIDMLAGPSEVLVIADESAHPAYIAADMLAQAEHDPDAVAILISVSQQILTQTLAELSLQLSALPEGSPAHASIENNGMAILAGDLFEAAAISNEVAPEHLELAIRDPESLLPSIQNAGSIFLGEYAPEPLGDYLAGPNHTLPTSGTAKFFSPLSTYDFMKRSSVISYSESALKNVAGQIATFAKTEGLVAHARSVEKRFDA